MAKPTFFLFSLLAVIAAFIAGVHVGRSLKEIEIANPSFSTSPTTYYLPPTTIPSVPPTPTTYYLQPTTIPSPTPRAHID